MGAFVRISGQREKEREKKSAKAGEKEELKDGLRFSSFFLHTKGQRVCVLKSECGITVCWLSIHRPREKGHIAVSKRTKRLGRKKNKRMFNLFPPFRH